MWKNLDGNGHDKGGHPLRQSMKNRPCGGFLLPAVAAGWEAAVAQRHGFDQPAFCRKFALFEYFPPERMDRRQPAR